MSDDLIRVPLSEDQASELRRLAFYGPAPRVELQRLANALVLGRCGWATYADTEDMTQLSCISG